ncbi:MAG: histidine kinase [Bacteroidia bacterium]|nr:histidine kinase [Bacteroidia bacterium]
MKSKRFLLVIQIIAWLVFIIFPAFIYSTIQPSIANGVLNPTLTGIILLHTLLMGFYYFNYYYLIPKFYFPKKNKIYFGIIVASLFSMFLIMQMDEAFSPFYQAPIKYGYFLFLFSIKIRFIMIVLLSLGIANYNRLKQIEEEKLKAELSYLKAQINPHFLFNTLNSVYALAVQKSDSAPESITKLSAIMRYSITDAAQDFVGLDKELNYINALVELEKLRLTDKVKLNYTVTGPTAGKQIAPQIFIPFVENAFKYGVSTQENSVIDIAINIENNNLNVSVKNTKIRTDTKNKLGLGIENTKKRLSLIYPGKHNLEIKDSEKDFSVHLTLTLND